jgi:hypothetical protein
MVSTEVNNRPAHRVGRLAVADRVALSRAPGHRGTAPRSHAWQDWRAKTPWSTANHHAKLGRWMERIAGVVLTSPFACTSAQLRRCAACYYVD